MRNTKYWQMTSKLLLISFCCLLPVTTFAQTVNEKKLTAREIAKQTLPSVVLLIMGNSKTETAKSGSGFFVTEDIVATNFHVIKDTDEGVAKIIGQDKLYDVLGIVGVDEKNDLALLKIKGIKGKPLTLNKDDSTAIGDEVFAVGNPKGLEGTFSQGIVSSIRKSEKINLLQITASISAGSSGGAILNNKGEVIAVAVGAIESGQSLNFAVPVSLLRVLISKNKPLASISAITKPSSNKNSSLQFKVSDTALENLVGNIKSVKEYVYSPEMKFGKVELGKPAEIISTEYNLEGNTKFRETTRFATYPKSSYLDDYTSGLKPDYQETVNVFKHEFTYDYQSKTVAKNYNSYFNGNRYSGLTIAKYQNNQIIEETEYDSNRKPTSKRIIQINGDKKTVEIEYDEDGKECKRKETLPYTNEKNEKIIEVKFVGSTCYVGFNYVEVLKQSAENTEIQKTIFDKNNNPLTIVIRILDNKTKLLKYATIVSEDYKSEILKQEFKYEYDFDSKGNWIKRTAYEQVSESGKTYFEPFNIIKREITYY